MTFHNCVNSFLSVKITLSVMKKKGMLNVYAIANIYNYHVLGKVLKNSPILCHTEKLLDSFNFLAI